MYYVTRMNRIDDVNEYEYLNGAKGKWVEDVNDAQGYKTFNGAKRKFITVAKVYEGYYGDYWANKVEANFLAISFESDNQSVKHCKLDFEF